MFVRQMAYLVALSREGHFSRAASKCHVTQSTLSAGLKALERELGMRLVVRKPRFSGLTPEGERVVEWARQIIADYDNLKSEVEGFRNGLCGVLRLGVVPAAMPSVCDVTHDFRIQHPQATIEARSMTSTEIQKGLKAFELDAGITYLDNEPPADVRRFPIYRERYALVVARQNPLAVSGRATWAQASKEKLCLLTEDMQNRRIINKVARSQNLQFRPQVTANSFLGICSHVTQGGFSSIVPRNFKLVFGDSPDHVMLDLVDPVHEETIGLVTSDRDPLAPLAEAMIASTIRAHKSNGVLEHT